VLVEKATLVGTTNGVRIKTWQVIHDLLAAGLPCFSYVLKFELPVKWDPTIFCYHRQGGEGYAERITFRDIRMFNVTNPIIIDQNYCDSKKPCSEQVLYC
jgi:hypothetical protein